MAKIKIEDLPKNMKINKEDLKKVLGGVKFTPNDRDIILKGRYSVRSSSFINLGWQNAPAPVCTELG